MTTIYNGPPTADIHGREYARIGNLRAGCRVQFDGDHGCMPDQAVRQVKCDADGEFYVECNCGKHLLIDDDGILVGVYSMNSKEPIVHFEGKDMPASEWLAQIARGKSATWRDLAAASGIAPGIAEKWGNNRYRYLTALNPDISPPGVPYPRLDNYGPFAGGRLNLRGEHAR